MRFPNSSRDFDSGVKIAPIVFNSLMMQCNRPLRVVSLELLSAALCLAPGMLWWRFLPLLPVVELEGTAFLLLLDTALLGATKLTIN